jgi:hypothetical protein
MNFLSAKLETYRRSQNVRLALVEACAGKERNELRDAGTVVEVQLEVFRLNGDLSERKVVEKVGRIDIAEGIFREMTLESKKKTSTASPQTFAHKTQ